MHGTACGPQQMKRLVDRNSQTKRRNQTTAGQRRTGQRAATQRDSTALCRQFECDQGCVKLQARPRIDLPCPGGVQPDPPALLIAC